MKEHHKEKKEHHKEKKESDHKKPKSDHHKPPSTPLDPSGALSNTIGSDWNVTWQSKTNNHKATSDGIVCSYPAGKFASAGGTNIVAQPSCFPAKSATLTYTVSIPHDFEFVKGGKAGPGLFVGEHGAGGGDYSDNGASFRVMWREGGTVVAYIYPCEDVGKHTDSPTCPMIKAQGKGFTSIAHFTGRTGIDLWRDGGMVFKKGEENHVELKMTLNTPGKADGLVSLTVNGKTNSFDGMRWRDAKDMDINGIMIATWFGGSDTSWAPKKDQTLKFKDVVVKTE